MNQLAEFIAAQDRQAYVLTPLEYERAHHRSGAYWAMGESVLRPREAFVGRLEPVRPSPETP